MKPEAGTRPSRTRSKAAAIDAWSLAPLDAGYPVKLSRSASSEKLPTLHGCGNREILRHDCLGLICSVQCPGSVVLKTLDSIRELRDRGMVVAGGFHSPMEQQCLDFLLRGEQPVIVCPAKHPGRVRLSPQWQAAIEAGRLLLLAPFDETVVATNKARAQTRNEFVTALSQALLIPHASPGGKALNIAKAAVSRGTKLFTFDVEENRHLCDIGASRYDIGEPQGLPSFRLTEGRET